MISDTLSDAAHEMRVYLDNYPEAYAGLMRLRIETLLMAMDTVRTDLDTPPSEVQVVA